MPKPVQVLTPDDLQELRSLRQESLPRQRLACFIAGFVLFTPALAFMVISAGGYIEWVARLAGYEIIWLIAAALGLLGLLLMVIAGPSKGVELFTLGSYQSPFRHSRERQTQ